uniref:Far upstream element-binding protein C-terminal domain-containing protein n=1 Tax=Panagrolaimus sp. PS1159 TaxID=55785 RepID=A0AC35EVE7_9BILA
MKLLKLKPKKKKHLLLSLLNLILADRVSYGNEEVEDENTVDQISQISQYSQSLNHSPDLSIIPKTTRERVSSTPHPRRRTIPGSNFVPVYDDSFNNIDGANPDNEEDSNTPTPPSAVSNTPPPPPADPIEASPYNPNTASRDANTTALGIQSTSSDGNGDIVLLQNNDPNAINVERPNENTSPTTNLVTEPIVQRTTNQTSALSQNNHHSTPVNPFIEQQTQERTQPIQQYNHHSNEFHAQQTTADDSIFNDQYLQMSNKARLARLNAATTLKDQEKLAITMSNLNVNPFPPVQFPQQQQMPTFKHQQQQVYQPNQNYGTVMPPTYASPPYQQALVPPQHCYGLVAQSHHQQGQQSVNRYGIAPASWGQQTYGRYPTGNPVPHFSDAYYPTQPIQQHNYNSATGMPTENPNGGGFDGYNHLQHTPAPTDAIQWSNYYQQQQHQTYGPANLAQQQAGASATGIPTENPNGGGFELHNQWQHNGVYTPAPTDAIQWPNYGQQQQHQIYTNGPATLAQQQAASGGAPVQDYIAQWAEYYRQMGMHEKAAMIEEQFKKQQTSSTSQ